MMLLKDALKTAAKNAGLSTPLAKKVGWTAGDFQTRQTIRKDDEINAAYYERESQLDAERKRDIQAAWREYFRNLREQELSMPVYLGR